MSHLVIVILLILCILQGVVIWLMCRRRTEPILPRVIVREEREYGLYGTREDSVRAMGPEANARETVRRLDAILQHGASLYRLRASGQYTIFYSVKLEDQVDEDGVSKGTTADIVVRAATLEAAIEKAEKAR